jgi:hypothetical protein
MVDDGAMPSRWHKTYLYKPLRYLRPGAAVDSSESSQGLLEGLLAMDKITVLEASPTSLEHAKSPSQNRSRRRKWWQFGGKDISYVSVDDGLYPGSDNSSISDSPSLVKNVANVFEAPEAAEIYKPIQGFEGAHRFDPSATWTPEEEKVLVRRVCLAQVVETMSLTLAVSSTG